MNKQIISLVAAAAIVSSMAAANLKVDVDKSHNLWWNAPEHPLIGLSLTDTVGASPSSQLRVYLTKDTMPSEIVFDRTYPVDGETVLSVEIPNVQPGFYKMHISDDGNIVSESWIGYEPTNVVSLPDSQPDFDEFWKRAKDELAAIPANVTLVAAPELSGKNAMLSDAHISHGVATQ